MKQDPVTPEVPKWDTVYLVCKDCGKRSSGPKGFKPKAVARGIRQVDKDRRPRPRIVMTACLGMCPKGAVAVAIAGEQVATRIVAVRDEAQIDETVRSLNPSVAA